MSRNTQASTRACVVRLSGVMLVALVLHPSGLNRLFVLPYGKREKKKKKLNGRCWDDSYTIAQWLEHPWSQAKVPCSSPGGDSQFFHFPFPQLIRICTMLWCRFQKGTRHPARPQCPTSVAATTTAEAASSAAATVQVTTQQPSPRRGFP